MCISSKPISITAQLPMWLKSGDNTCPLVLAIIIPKPLCFSSSGYALQDRTATVPFHHDALPSQLLRIARFDSFGTAPSETATALNQLPLYPLYLTTSEQFASSSSCSTFAIENSPPLQPWTPPLPPTLRVSPPNPPPPVSRRQSTTR